MRCAEVGRGCANALARSRTMADSHFILFQRDHCPLCDEALAVLAEAGMPDFETVWIDDDEALEALYGILVPVLRDARTDRELGWPFDAGMVRGFLDGG
jgi:hypothetical protein